MYVFIIDDDLSFGKSLKRMLGSRGYPAHYYNSADSFLDAVPSGQGGIAIIDLHLSKDNGLSLLKTMREMHYLMPVIILTGQTDNDTRDLVFQAGAIGFLQKPFNEQSLLDLLESQQKQVVG